MNILGKHILSKKSNKLFLKLSLIRTNNKAKILHGQESFSLSNRKILPQKFEITQQGFNRENEVLQKEIKQLVFSKNERFHGNFNLNTAKNAIFITFLLN